MIFTWLILQLKSVLLTSVNVFRRAFCCFRKRRNSYSDTEQLTQVLSNKDTLNNDSRTWSEWGQDAFKDEPKSIQDYIERYRQQTIQLRSEKSDEERQEQENFFEDMAPRITKQTKVLIGGKSDESTRGSRGDRLTVADDTINVAPSGELGEWDENSGWEGEHLLDQEAQRVLREQKRLERERKVWEQNQKRLEKASRTLGSKVTA